MSKTWPILLLGEVLKERQEIPSTGALAKGEMRIVAKIGFNDGKIQLRSGSETNTGMILVRPGDLLVSGINAAKGAIAIYGEENTEPIAATIHYGAYTPNKSRVDVNYLWWLLRSNTFRDLLLRYVPGGIKTELKAKRLLPIPVPLPSLDEQRRIVAKIEDLIWKVDEAIALRKLILNDLNSLFGAQLEQLFQHLAKSFGSVPLLDVVDPHRGISYGVVLTGLDFENGIPTLRAGDLQRFRVALDSVKRIDPNIEAKYKRTRLRGNEVLLRIRGGLGEVAVCPKEMIDGNVSREIAVIPVTDRLDVYYLMYALATPSSQDFMKSKTRGTSYMGINLRDVRKLPVPVPPAEEQYRVVIYLDGLRANIERLKQVQFQTTIELEALFPSILDKAFKGEL